MWLAQVETLCDDAEEDSHLLDADHHRVQIAHMLRLATPILMPAQRVGKQRRQAHQSVVKAVIRAFQVGAESFVGIADAVRWGAGGYSIKMDVGSGDLEEFLEVGSDLTELCRRKQDRLAEGRLSLERIDACLTDEMVDSPRPGCGSWPLLACPCR